jgi:hypothetical protein
LSGIRILRSRSIRGTGPGLFRHSCDLPQASTVWADEQLRERLACPVNLSSKDLQHIATEPWILLCQMVKIITGNFANLGVPQNRLSLRGDSYFVNPHKFNIDHRKRLAICSYSREGKDEYFLIQMSELCGGASNGHVVVRRADLHHQNVSLVSVDQGISRIFRRMSRAHSWSQSTQGWRVETSNRAFVRGRGRAAFMLAGK